MEISLAKRPAVFGTIIHADDQPKLPSSYKDIASANDHLQAVLDALLKERSGQPLTPQERHLIDCHIAAKRWQLENTRTNDDV